MCTEEQAAKDTKFIQEQSAAIIKIVGSSPDDASVALLGMIASTLLHIQVSQQMILRKLGE